MIHEIVEVKQLTKREKQALSRKMLGYGKVKAAIEATGLHRTTLYRALETGTNMDVDTLNAIRKFLSNQSKAA
jgi:DNA-binding phage protein